ncbi:hypothetical protein DFP72DRAFT_442409 [Ephemerocybe angulata]|uniref:Uncharacterized protein n=1 Tax=Ephemerocybe angulata TaxID=980116 RepID=A0A8H6M295_9AGAR|nr:hypothetical protein DFP72DRAFT_442409 [Tulosesus angulatus]
MGLTIGKDDTLGIRAINALFMGGMLVDIMAAMMGYLTIRWLERMRDAEQTLLNKLLQLKTNGRKADSATGAKPVNFDSASINIGPPSLAHKFMALSLMIPLPFVMIGIAAMLAGIYVYVWTQHPTPVAIVVTVMGLSTLPFIACDFMIGRNEDRRKFIIRRLCELQGDW